MKKGRTDGHEKEGLFEELCEGRKDGRTDGRSI
jgi:hypothetical protein